MKPRKYTPSKRVRNHIAKWEASDFAGQNAAFGGDAVGAKAIELMDMLGDKANAFTDNELDGLLSTYYNLSPRGFRKTLMPYIDAYAADLSDVNKKGLDLAMRDRWRIAAKKYQKGIRRRANADADLMGLSYQDPIVEQPDVIKRTNIVVPEENTEATWKGAENVSPYVTGKPIIKLQPRLKLPPIEELMEDSAWEPSFRLNPRGYKNGKLPRYKDGTRYIPNDSGGWDRITDDPTADVFADFVVTPKGNRTEKVVNRPGAYDLKLREQLRNAGYVTDEMLETDNRLRQQAQLKGRGEKGLEVVSPEFDLLAISPIFKEGIAYGGKKIADKLGFFVLKPGTYTRGIGGEQGLQDLLESGLVRGNPVGTEMSAKNFTKHYKFDRNHFKTIMDNTGLDGIAQRYYNRTLSKKDFDAIKESAKPYIEEYNSLPKEAGKILLFRESPDPLDGYTTYDDYLAQLIDDRRTLANATSFDESGQPLAYFYDDGRNPITSGHSYAASKYGVRINNASDYSPRIFPGHLHYSIPRAVSLNDPNVELFRRGPFGITIRMRKPIKYRE